MTLFVRFVFRKIGQLFRTTLGTPLGDSIHSAIEHLPPDLQEQAKDFSWGLVPLNRRLDPLLQTYHVHHYMYYMRTT